MIGCWGGGHPDDGERETVKRPVRRDAKVGNMMAGKSTECSHFFPNFFFSFFFYLSFFFPPSSATVLDFGKTKWAVYYKKALS